MWTASAPGRRPCINSYRVASGYLAYLLMGSGRHWAWLAVGSHTGTT